jgi:predicted RNA binding protein YcfA (HicA-like mRNA interferase family)
MSGRRNSKEVLKYAREQGYTVTPTGGSHWMARHPCGATVTLSNSVNGNYRKREMERLLREKKRRAAQ